MIKIIGIGFVLGGALCGILTWDSGKKEKIRLIEDIIDFLRRAESAVEHQMPVIDFLKTYACEVEKKVTFIGMRENIRDEMKENVPGRMKEHVSGRLKENPFRNAIWEFSFELEKYEWGSGDEAWKFVLNKNQKQWSFNQNHWNFNQNHWNFNEEQWEAVSQIGQIASGRGKSAIMEILALQKDRLLEMERAEHCKLSEQRKVFVPVGMLAGVMLVLIFL